MSGTDKLYSALLRRDAGAEAELPDDVRRNVPRNGLRLVAANALQSTGDQTVNASTVLPWLLTALGAPAALIGLLVPIRESLSMLPQAFLTPIVVRVRRRTRVFAAGAVVQAAAVAVMAATAALGEGLAAGTVILVALAIFALGRCLCSIASKDVQGRTVPKGERGQINGLATTASGIVAITLGLAIRVWGGDDLTAGILAWILAAGAALWVASAAVSRGVREPAPAAVERSADDPGWFADTLRLLREDRDFRLFVAVRGLLVVSALAPPFVVSLAVAAGSDGLAGLGGFVVASGVAALVGGRIFGRWADRSSRRVMTYGAAAASAVIIAVVAATSLPGFSGSSAGGTIFFIGAYFALTLIHTGVRVGRKTYVVDMAEGDLRTTYVAVSNTAMGVILLVIGGISSLIALAGASWALLFLAVMGFVGVIASRGLRDVSRGRTAG
ncbi:MULTISPECIES: MFS transporter [unclassified Microbacterium]|uniref:MFS transporter n=1 Tax=unclassified Microbacterium TaxID=2609290 RepID=UPI00386BC2F9